MILTVIRRKSDNDDQKKKFLNKKVELTMRGSHVMMINVILTAIRRKSDDDILSPLQGLSYFLKP